MAQPEPTLYHKTGIKWKFGAGNLSLGHSKAALQSPDWLWIHNRNDIKQDLGLLIAIKRINPIKSLSSFGDGKTVVICSESREGCKSCYFKWTGVVSVKGYPYAPNPHRFCQFIP